MKIPWFLVLLLYTQQTHMRTHNSIKYAVASLLFLRWLINHQKERERERRELSRCNRWWPCNRCGMLATGVSLSLSHHHHHHLHTHNLPFRLLLLFLPFSSRWAETVCVCVYVCVRRDISFSNNSAYLVCICKWLWVRRGSVTEAPDFF